MNITLITVGKLKEAFYSDAVKEYAKRLSKYCKLNIIEVPDEKTPDKSSLVQEELIKKIGFCVISKRIRMSLPWKLTEIPLIQYN